MMSHPTLSSVGRIKINQGKLSRTLRRGAWKLVNLLVVLAMLLPNFTFFVDQAMAADDVAATLKLRPNSLWKGFAQDEPVTPTPTPTGTPEPTGTITPTLTLTPTVTPTATLTPTVTITPTATLTPTLSPTSTLEPTPVVTETSSSEVELLLAANPAFVNPSGETFIDWEITGLGPLAEAQNLELVFAVPKGFEPHKSQKGEFDPISSTLRIEASKDKGRTHWQVSADFAGPYLITAELYTGEKLLASAEFQLEEHAAFVIRKSGGQAYGLGGRVKVTFPEGALDEDIDLTIEHADHSKLPNSLSGNPFELTARGQSRKQNIHQFKEKIAIEVSYDEAEISGYEGDLMLFYFNEEEQQWIPLRTRVDMGANQLVGYSDHFSTFDIDINHWQMANVPTMDSFQQSGFTGAATYNKSLWVPPGPGRLQPNLNVSYNSQVVDGSTARSQASWVGMGWSLDAGGYIERNMNGSNTYMEDDTFSIVANGVSSILLPYDDASAPSDVIAFRTADENFWKVWAYFSTTSGFERIERWEVWDKTGTKYTFGDQPLTAYNGSTNDDRGQYLSCEGNASAPDYQFWKWPLVHIGKTWDSSSSSFDAELNFFYQEDSQSTHCHESSPYRTTNLAVYPLEIRYDHNLYRVIFNRIANRLDYDDDWTTGVARNLYKKSRLNNIQVQHYNGSTWEEIRKYDFKYADEVGQDSIYHGIVWPAGGRTLTLVEIEEIGLNANSSLPDTEFTYGDNIHLTEASNGYGSKVEFVYEEWSEVDGAENQAFKQNASQYPMCSKDRVDNPDPYNSEPDDWKPVNNDIDVYCKRRHMEIESQESMSYIEAYKKLDERFLQPGGSYLVEVKEIAAEGGGTLWLGLSDGVSTQYSDGLANNGTKIDMSWKFDINLAATKLEVRIRCTNSVVGDECHVHDEIRVTPLTTRYRVTEKKLYSSASDNDPDVIAYTYTYDEPATNDPGHSAYVKDALDTYGDDGDNTYEDYLFSAPYGEFRGHAVSTSKDESGLTTTTYYHQDDYLKGRAHTTIVSKELLLDSFESSTLSTDWDDNSSPEIAWHSGDNALKFSNSGTSGAVWRTGTISASDGNQTSILTQFFIESGTSTSILAAKTGSYGQSDYRRWGIAVKNGNIYTHRCTIDGVTCAADGLIGSFSYDTWYVLQITTDDANGFLLRVWKRDDPNSVKRYEEQGGTYLPSGKDWAFMLKTETGTTWLDEYSEGRIHSISQTRYVANDNMATPNPLPHPKNKPAFMDLDIVWVYTDWSKQITLNGDASWEGTLTEYKYETSDYFPSDYSGPQYGNQTQVIESQWKNNAWVNYRATKTRYYPVANPNTYLVGLPTNANSYVCPDGVCDYDNADITESTRYLYDGNLHFWDAPSVGKLTTQRQLVCWVDNSSQCVPDRTYAKEG